MENKTYINRLIAPPKRQACVPIMKYVRVANDIVKVYYAHYKLRLMESLIDSPYKWQVSIEFLLDSQNS